MPERYHEAQFEPEICEYLAAHGWRYSPDDTGYDRERAFFPADLWGWLDDTQPDTLTKLRNLHNGNTEQRLVDRIVQCMEKDGTLAVLRHGVKHWNASFALFQPRPANTLNPTIWDRYRQVRLRVMRQVRYSVSNQNAIDLVLFVNGIPVATLELKTDFTQSVQQAIRQYQTDRWPRDAVTKKPEPLLTAKRGALVHFAVSTEEVWMTTALRGAATRFLPFNLGHESGAGNPPNPEGYRTGYLWEQILDRETWCDLLARYAHLERMENKTGPKTTVEEHLIFPRIHQWQAVHRLVDAAREEGPGHTYLIQHSAGSGKTHSIAWLSHQLASLHNAINQKVFDSVIVITDRTVLDDQLQDAIYQIEHKRGWVERIRDDVGPKSAQLVTALTTAAPIIIVTLQTVPFILDVMRSDHGLADRRFAVIADEAHSSMSGSAATKLKQVLASGDVDEGEDVSTEEVLAAEQAGRKLPPNTSFFAFTATPKAKTIELFGTRPDRLRLAADDNRPEPFHVYTMQQAIEERFILNVLQNYTPYQLAWKLAHQGQEYTDQTVDETQGLKQIGRWVRLHPYNIAQKVQIIVEHFRHNVMGRLAGQAKAMVVTGSRKEAVRYKLAIDAYLRERGETQIRALVAFSGEVVDSESGAEAFSERSMNPQLQGRDLREAFDTGTYNVLLVANKYQTGFDQPKLMAMYVDKKISGVAAVQTLSRLNRIYPGKDQTFILDFVNDPETIRQAFLPYYRDARLGGVSDPNVVHDLAAKLDAQGIYLESEVAGFWAVLADPQGTQADLHRWIQPAVERFRTRYAAAMTQHDGATTEALDRFRSDLPRYVRVYEFLAQIFDYQDTSIEQRYPFAKLLARLLRETLSQQPIDLSGVELTHYRLTRLDPQTIVLGDQTTTLGAVSALGSGQPQDPDMVHLSELIAAINALFEGELSEADRVAYTEHIAGKVMENPTVVAQARQNTKEQFALGAFDDALMDAVLEGLERYQGMASQVLGNDAVKARFSVLIRDLVYARLTRPTA